MTYPYRGRREDQRLLTGQGHYTDDWNLPGQLYAAFLRADRAHAEIVAIDSAAASAAPGVHAVLTGADSFAAGFHRTQTLLPFKGRVARRSACRPGRYWRSTGCGSWANPWPSSWRTPAPRPWTPRS